MLLSDPSPMLEVEAVRKSYGANSVLRGVNGSFAAGRIAAVVGPNGAGKTTLLRIIAGLQHADSGAACCTSGILYYGGSDLLPVNGRINQLRRGLGLEPVSSGSRRLSRLSRGELHRVGLDIAFEIAPEVLLLDEPWTALEPDAREALNSRLRSYAEGRVVICSTHDLDEVARIADDVMFLANGIGIWQRREELGDSFGREELIRIYRETKSVK